MYQKHELVTWEGILNDLNNVLGEIEYLSKYSTQIDVELEKYLKTQLKSIINRLKQKKRKKVVIQEFQVTLDVWNNSKPLEHWK